MTSRDNHETGMDSPKPDLASLGEKSPENEKESQPFSEKSTADEQRHGPDVDEYGGADIELQQTNTSLHTYPEGGLRAWLVVLGAWLAMISVMGLMNSLAIFQAYTVKHQLSNYSESTVGWIFSIYTFLAFFGGVYIGPVFDKHGPTWLLIAGVACTAASLISFSFCTELYQFILAFGVLGGLGTSLIYTPCIAAIGHWFKARRGLATGLATCAGGFGGIIFPLMLSSLFTKINFGWSIRALALICLCCGLCGIGLVRSRLPPAQNATAHPDFLIFKQIPLLLTTIGIFLLEFCLFIPLTYISTYALHEGFDEEFAYHLLPIMNAGSVVGRALPGYYADIVGPFNVCIFSVLSSLIACICIWLPLGHTTPGIIIFAVLFGFSSGTAIAIAPVCVGSLCKTQNYGRYYATTYTVASIACLIGIPIAGAILEAHGGSYTALIIFTTCTYVVSAVVMMTAKCWDLGWRKWCAAY